MQKVHIDPVLNALVVPLLIPKPVPYVETEMDLITNVILVHTKLGPHVVVAVQQTHKLAELAATVVRLTIAVLVPTRLDPPVVVKHFQIHKLVAFAAMGDRLTIVAVVFTRPGRRAPVVVPAIRKRAIHAVTEEPLTRAPLVHLSRGRHAKALEQQIPNHAPKLNLACTVGANGTIAIQRQAHRLVQLL